MLKTRLRPSGWVLLAFAALWGCDEADRGVSQGGALTVPANISVDASAPSRGGAFRWDASSPNASPAGSDLKDAPGAPGKSAIAQDKPEALAQASRAMFDGDKRSLGALGHETPVKAEGDGSVKVANYTAPARKDTLKTHAPPSPASLIKLDAASLPEPAKGEGTLKGAGLPTLLYASFQKKMYETVYPLFGRPAWKPAKPKFASPPQKNYRVTVHNTAGPQTMTEAETLAAVHGTQDFHMSYRVDGKSVGKEEFERRKAAGEGRSFVAAWDDIGYHYMIDGAGRVVEGRHAEVLGAHAGGANEGNVGIAFMGNFNKDKLTDDQLASFRRLVTFLAIKYGIHPKSPGFLEPHLHYNNTDCPGKNVMSILDKIREEIARETDGVYVRLRGASGDQTVTADIKEFVPLVTSQPEVISI